MISPKYGGRRPGVCIVYFWNHMALLWAATEAFDLIQSHEKFKFRPAFSWGMVPLESSKKLMTYLKDKS